ncbi:MULTISPECIES: tetratricopeptide repeat protein [Arthrospira]|jgi:tetratricopeptide (TPR) repeat protein|uniref:TPR domain protein n=1 Tax=Limnospira platensis NIES-46 TaxID=1236695 RepID=A0A5M3T528_LIMPL|nr:tetratricopeptide repeat protein [Arthrospira platensis]AMW26893.1 hypothetical protein AP285_01650 [Arthrospira platensis YZ]MDF2211720.1 tetratricopeptide repeat protein [Arthrospira platensis NCB002]MDT9183455.1 tetratricopeptide repeat protein [Limnospira sp. PMC 289.06]MDT9294487.1 tetratricopeptide repeat protein [Arthrospira platensis PCC 7345]MDT9311229.1 tetratricopeptide repeat protein [Limnospira sp. Paracas R14]QQW29642.1 tetratricopeptide repeat protein [Arthrospira sp. PCC 91
MTGRWVSSLLTVSLLLGMGSLSPWVEAQTVLVQGRLSQREVEELLQEALKQTRQGQPVQAIETFERVLEAARQWQHRQLEAVALLGIGRNYNRIGQRQKALEFYEQALIPFRETNNRSGEATILTNIGLVYNALGNRTKSLDYFNQALPIFREVGDRSGEATTLSNIASVYRDTNQPDKAITHWEDSLNILLSLRSELQKEFRETFLQTNRGPAVALVDILIDQNQPQRAFEWANRFTTYELADYNRLIGVRVANPEAQAALDDRKIGYKPRPLA